MSRLRVIFDNAAYRAALLASSAAGTRTVDRLLTNMKTDVWRATGTSATLTLTWPTPEIIGGVALPFCNITSGATIRARGYTYIDDVVPVVDSGEILAAPYAAVDESLWGIQPVAPNAYRRGGCETFATGGGAYARCWIEQSTISKLVVDINDDYIEDGYLEFGRVCVGPYWEPEYNHSWGVKVGLREDLDRTRGGGGDMFSVVQSRGKRQSFDLGSMTARDLAMFWSILLANGATGQFLISLYPDDADPIKEQINMLFGSMAPEVAAVNRYLGTYQTSITMEEV